MNKMGSRIKQKRLEKGMTGEELGRILNVQKSAVSKWERGAVENISQTKIMEMAKLFGCSPSWLMGYDAEDESTLKQNPQKKMGADQIIAELYNSYNHDLLNRKPEGASPRHRQELEEDKPTVSEFKEALELYRKYKEAIPQVQDAVDALLKKPQSGS